MTPSAARDPETEEKLLDRHRRCLAAADSDSVYVSKVVVFVHAFPSVDFEYPAGHMMRCNDWRLDL